MGRDFDFEAEDRKFDNFQLKLKNLFLDREKILTLHHFSALTEKKVVSERRASGIQKIGKSALIRDAILKNFCSKWIKSGKLLPKCIN